VPITTFTPAGSIETDMTLPAVPLLQPARTTRHSREMREYARLIEVPAKGVKT
jgi:hypothetical protein